ncbi:MAG: transposase [Actinomycetota bacterium]|nr:transposase [Actinomycetota bacterium]
MSRPPRSFAAGGWYHLTARANGHVLFLDDHDRDLFVRLLSRVAVRFALDVDAWCLMGNHYHLVVRTQTGDVSRAMKYLNGEYARRFNERHGFRGHVFESRFRATAVVDEAHLEEVRRYVLENPVRAGLASTLNAWPWAGAVGVAS